jgi:hypothetical protein
VKLPTHSDIAGACQGSGRAGVLEGGARAGAQAPLHALSNGECIVRDLDDRADRIGVDLVSEELRDSIETDPMRPPAPKPARLPRTNVRCGGENDEHCRGIYRDS